MGAVGWALARFGEGLLVMYLGHSRNGDGDGVNESLKVHLVEVSNRVAGFMSIWGYEGAGLIAGLFHDLGKYADQMQRRLRSPRTVEGRNHTAAGAYYIAYQHKNSAAVALAVLYHHGGLKRMFLNRKELLQYISNGFSDVPDRYTETNLNILMDRFRSEFFEIPSVTIPRLLNGKIASDMLDVRLMASALVDADFIETEAHFAGDASVLRRYRPEGVALNEDRALQAVFSYLKGRTTDNAVVRDVRQHLSADCQQAGALPPGAYFLTAPTGAGKTLAMLLFALIHAKKNGLRRIVLVMPFLNIIDQTAKMYREIFSKANGFSANYVLEDHSLAGFKGDEASDDLEEDENRTRKLLTENWDAPIVLTTSVKFFESLHASRNTGLRKLHRLAKSVVLFDEAQSLPPNLAPLSLATLSRLCENDSPYGSSVVFATATQPAFESISPMVKKFANYGWSPNSLIPNETVEMMFKAMSNRVHVEWRDQVPVALDELAVELVDNSSGQCLCIVNLKRHASQLVELVDKKLGGDAVFHLSTSMCLKHRDLVRDLVQKRLDSGEPVVLIATQCIEAGVDISFPRVYRALAPLDSIAQAAGRCNRHGEASGTVVVFLPSDEKGYFPPGYGEGISTTKTLLADYRRTGVDPSSVNLLNDPMFIRRYYKIFFELGGYAEERQEQALLHEAVVAGNFEEVSKHYKLIPGDMINVLVPYDQDAFNRLSAEVRDSGFMRGEEIRNWVARAREYSVGIYRPNPDAMKWQALEPVQFGAMLKYDNHDADWFICLPEAQYDSLCGLKLPDDFVGIC
jgi:CRISPR-associated helicase Cas3/CRISPR-associated endonuclease Cas3-HD